MSRKKLFEKIQRLENELLSAPPSKAAKLAVEIVKCRGQVFDE